MSKITDYLLKDDVIVVMDVDGVLQIFVRGLLIKQILMKNELNT